VKENKEESKNVMEGEWNELKPRGRGDIYRVVGDEIWNFLDFFWIFWAGKNGEFFSSNGRIRIQMVKFQFKRINHEPPRHYRPPAPAAGGSAGATARPGSNAGGIIRPG
jgi:hypothetical protein